ncbi:MAG: L,D-transpeptidase, partial [Thermomicrobiales bacterium]
MTSSTDNTNGHPSRRLSRRRFNGIVGMGAALAALQPTRYFARGASAQDIHVVDEKTKAVVETIGESNMTVYVPETGHTMSSALLDYYRVTGRSEYFGFPISEPFETEAGVYSQIMEKGMIQYVPELMFTLEPFVRFGPNGRAMLKERQADFRADGRRTGGGGNPRAGAWAMPKGTELEGWVGAYGDFGADVAEPFQDWYWEKEGRFYLGFPLSGLVNDGGRYGQWFEGGYVTEGPNGPELAPLGPIIAEMLGVDTTPVEQGDTPTDDENIFLSVPNPMPTAADPAGPGAKHIYVNLNQQHMEAYAGDQVVLSTPVSTGLWPNRTENGNFRIRNKTRTEDMRCATDAIAK